MLLAQFLGDLLRLACPDDWATRKTFVVGVMLTGGETVAYQRSFVKTSG